MMEDYIKLGKRKLDTRKPKTFILAVMAGMFIALAGAGSTLISSTVDNFSIARLLSGIIFPIGLFLVIFFKTELFTGNSLLVILKLNKDTKMKNILVNWIIVYLGNLIGALIIVLLIFYSGITDKIGVNFIAIMNNKINLSIINMVTLGVMCNILVCASVYLASIMSENVSKIIVIFLPIFLFIVLGLEHSVANMFYLFIGYLLDSSISMWLILKNLLFVTIGNIIGGGGLGYLIYYVNKK